MHRHSNVRGGHRWTAWATGSPMEQHPHLGRTGCSGSPPWTWWSISSSRCRPSAPPLWTDWSSRGCRARSQSRAPLSSAANGWRRIQTSGTIPRDLERKYKDLEFSFFVSSGSIKVFPPFHCIADYFLYLRLIYNNYFFILFILYYYYIVLNILCIFQSLCIYCAFFFLYYFFIYCALFLLFFYLYIMCIFLIVIFLYIYTYILHFCILLFLYLFCIYLILFLYILCIFVIIKI